MTETPNPHIVDPDTLTGDMRPIRPAVLSLGSNLGDRLGNLQGALDALSDTPEVHIVQVSSVYETTPVGAPPGSEDFLNVIVLADSTLSVSTLLDRVQAVEAAFGRERTVPNAPRTLDVDLVVVGDRLSDSDHLRLPHPGAHERAFVLVPWQEVDAEATIPGRGRVADLLTGMDVSGVRRTDLALHL
ncbi:MAG TPA: 2-amino-4-hydroxy-6-hydroxymethyldihydropteridine diphosphokinase [Nocardioidaceae bacterium]|nr:2-amino-4-hydroxy-6-hydroxymethyldihydropteridine diphosphokinase [Nocardioidaceae bacterium]